MFFFCNNIRLPIFLLLHEIHDRIQNRVKSQFTYSWVSSDGLGYLASNYWVHAKILYEKWSHRPRQYLNLKSSAEVVIDVVHKWHQNFWNTQVLGKSGKSSSIMQAFYIYNVASKNDETVNVTRWKWWWMNLHYPSHSSVFHMSHWAFLE